MTNTPLELDQTWLGLYIITIKMSFLFSFIPSQIHRGLYQFYIAILGSLGTGNLPLVLSTPPPFHSCHMTTQYHTQGYTVNTYHQSYSWWILFVIKY